MKIYLFLVAILTCAACSQRHASQGTGPGPAVRTPAPWTAVSNGKLIYLTGRDRDGQKIVAAAAPLRPSCAACHGANGAGGQKFPDGAVSADLRHSVLVGKQKPPYTLATLQRAISQGIDNQGKPLDKVMPRWKLSQRDLHDVAQYVYSQLK
ncbi:MAG: c-type cytochrome [Candidatus Eremiobacteraeota bacterium]|nr:c-type cytochrome [Candidatus Eremiobacteraeota bacterium]